MKILDSNNFINEKLNINPISKLRLDNLKGYIPPIVANDSNIHKLVSDSIKKYGNKANRTKLLI